MIRDPQGKRRFYPKFCSSRAHTKPATFVTRAGSKTGSMNSLDSPSIISFGRAAPPQQDSPLSRGSRASVCELVNGYRAIARFASVLLPAYLPSRIMCLIVNALGSVRSSHGDCGYQRPCRRIPAACLQ